MNQTELAFAYKRALAKLSTMFYRTENCKDAASQFRSLEMMFQQSEENRYAAFCRLAVGRCEEAIHNTLGAAVAYSNSGQTFLKFESDNFRCLVPNFRENVLEATQCYLMAVECYREKQLYNLCGVLLLELGVGLASLQEFEGAVLHIRRAAEMLQGDSALAAVCCLTRVMQFQLELGCYREASNTCQAACDLAMSTSRRQSTKSPVESLHWIGEMYFCLACLFVILGEQARATEIINTCLFDPSTLAKAQTSTLSTPLSPSHTAPVSISASRTPSNSNLQQTPLSLSQQLSIASSQGSLTGTSGFGFDKTDEKMTSIVSSPITDFFSPPSLICVPVNRLFFSTACCLLLSFLEKDQASFEESFQELEVMIESNSLALILVLILRDKFEPRVM
eukprot:c2936_g1_i1.p3 GENE.c2936_g1_i1~~c2936_g1_i1.p3  ORF type:complete len:393 (+),score=88.30 c2936_g1_i1:1865-3043(+)